MKVFIIAQIFGFLGMSLNVISYQAKKQKNIIIQQLFGSLFFAINMFLLNATMGALLNMIGFIRAFVYARKDKIKNINLCNITFISLYFISYFCVFLFFGKEITFKNIFIELLPLIAMITTTISYSKSSAANVRRFALLSSPSWLVYNCVNISIGGILCEIFSLISVILAILRLDVKKGEKYGD